MDHGHTADDEVLCIQRIQLAAQPYQILYSGWPGVLFLVIILSDHVSLSSKLKNRYTPFGMNGLSPRKITAIFNNPAAKTIPPFPGRLLPMTFILASSPSILNPRSWDPLVQSKYRATLRFFLRQYEKYSNNWEIVKTVNPKGMGRGPVTRRPETTIAGGPGLLGAWLRDRLKNSNYILLKIPIEIQRLEHGPEAGDVRSSAAGGPGVRAEARATSPPARPRARGRPSRRAPRDCRRRTSGSSAPPLSLFPCGRSTSPRRGATLGTTRPPRAP